MSSSPNRKARKTTAKKKSAAVAKPDSVLEGVGHTFLTNICDKLQLLAQKYEALENESRVQREALETLQKAAKGIAVVMDRNSEISNAALITLETQLKTVQLYLEGRSELAIDWPQYKDAAEKILSSNDHAPVEMTVEQVISTEASGSEPSEPLQATAE